jgi:hypothetical protein
MLMVPLTLGGLWRFGVFFLIGSKAHFQKKLFVNYGAISAT